MNEQDILESLLASEAPKQKTEDDILGELLGGTEKPQEQPKPTARAYSKETRQPIADNVLDAQNAKNQAKADEIKLEAARSAYLQRKAEANKEFQRKQKIEDERQRQSQRVGGFGVMPQIPTEFATRNMSEREFARQEMEKQTGKPINRDGFANVLANISEKTHQATLNIPLMESASQAVGNLVAGAGQTIKAGTQAMNATQQPAQGQLTPWGAGPNLQMRAPDFTQAKKTAAAAGNQFAQAGEALSTMLPEPVQKILPKGKSNILERKSTQRLKDAEEALKFNLAEQDFEARADYQQIVKSAEAKHSQGQELSPDEKFAASIESKKGLSGLAKEAGETLWMLATDERTQEEFGRASTLDLPAMIVAGGPTGALASQTTRIGLNALSKGIDAAKLQRFNQAVQRAQGLRQKLDDLKGQPAAAGVARQYEQQIAKVDKLIEAKKSDLLKDLSKPLISGKSAEELAAFAASEGIIASGLDLGRQIQEGGQLDAESLGRAIVLNLVTEAAIDAPSLGRIVANERTGANRDKQTQGALRGALDLGETPAGTDLDPRLEQAAAIDRTRGRRDLKQAGEIIGTERTRGANEEQFAENKIVLDPQKTGGTIELTREQASAQGYAKEWDALKEKGQSIVKNGQETIKFKVKGSTDSSGKINLGEGFNRTDYREEHLHALQSRISKFRTKNRNRNLDSGIAREYAQHERNLQKYFARQGIKPSQMSATLDEQIAKDLVRGLDSTGEASAQYAGQIFDNAPPMPAALRAKLEKALGGRQVVQMPTANAVATATQVQPEEQASEISPKPTPEPAKPNQTKAEPTAQTTSEISPDEDADPEGQAIEPTIKGAIAGKGGRAFSEDNTPLPYKWAVIDENSVTASIGANATNQPRDRSRAASQQQIKDLSQRMNFKLASGSGESVGSGAPVLTKDGVILAGNGRIAGMGLGYESNSKAMAAYKADLQKAAKKYGIDPAQIQGLERPILVRVTGFDSQDADNVKKWAKVSNQEGAAQYSPAELAKQDAESLNLGEFAAEYPLNHTANGNFVRKFVSQIPAKDRAPLVDAKGQLSVDGEKRLSRAVLAKAYGEHSIISEMIEATDPEGTNLLNALKGAAPAIAQAGAKELADKALEAVQYLRNANAKNLSPTELAAQQDALKEQDPFVVALAQEFKDNARSFKKLAETLGELAERSTAPADEAAPDMMDLMGLAPSEPKGLAQHLADIQIERENSKAETLEGEGFRFSLIGPLLANQEQTDKLLQAQDMEAKGESAYWIWSKTGWFRSPWDDKWKIEVSDKDFDFDFVSGNFDQLKIKNHPLEKENIPIHVVDDKSTSWAGMFSPKRKEIAINLAHIQNGFNNTPEKIREEIKSTLLHELQHAIQEKEGFEKGANTQHNGYSMPQAVFNMYVKAKAIQDKADSRINEIDKDHNGLISALVSHGAGQDYKAALEEINQFNQLLELAKNIQRADINPLYIRKIGDPLTYEAQRATNWDQYYRKPRSGLFNRTFKSTAHKHAAFSDFFKNYNRLKFEELKKWAQLNNIQWFPENMRDLIGTGGGINKEGLAQYKKQAFSSLKAFIKKFNLKGRENARNTIKEFKKIEEASANIFKLIQKINNDEISAYDAYLRAGGEYEARLVQARAKEGQQGFPLDANRQNRKEHKLQHENAPIPSANRADLWDMAADIRFSLETIEVDGKERPTKNSNGQPIAQSAEGLRNFWRWFGDSKVVDEEGKPLVVYHGARGDFVEFSDSNENKLPWMEGSKGFYFTSNRDVALGYGEIAMPAYIKALNIKQSQNHEHTYISNKKLESLRSNGFDAIYFDGKFVNVQGDMAQTSDEYVVFDPTQIKSATGNTGAFSPDNADIRFSLAPATDSKEFKAWFKDSKVVNEDGSPKVVYHGSSVDFNVFDIRKAGKEHGQTEGTGFYFTENERIGKGYVKDKEKGKLFEVYLSIQKPILYDQKPFTSAQMQKVLARITELEVEDSGMEWQDTFLSNMVDTYSAKSIKNAVIEASKFFDEETALDQIGSLSSMNISKEIINQSVYETLGYDGFKAQGFGNIGDESDIIWVAMFPEQIKSATENTGAFDPKNPDIRYSLTTETPEFKRWFDGSKIVDEEGKPLVVYHGTTAEFTQFEEEFMGEASGQLDLGRGFYFTPDPDTAASFGDGEGSNLMPVFLSIKNPATNRDLETDEIQDILADDMGFTDAQDYLKEQGFDGIVYTHRSGQREIVAFEPEQIKSALGNRGTFDAGNPDIRFSLENLRGVPHPDRPENFVDRSMDFLYSSPMGAAYDRLYQALVDDFNPARRIEQQAGILDRRSAPKSNDAAEESAYVANQMRAGKVRDAIESAENLLRPILKQLRKEGKTLEEAGEFLYAQHAPDYNREMAKINPPRERVQEILEQLMEGQEIDTENAAEPWLETLAADAQAWLEKNGERTEGTALEQASFDVDQKKLDRYLGAWRTQAEIDAGLSGMSTAEAKEIVKQGRQSRGLVALSQAIGQLRDKMRAEMIESGLISFEQGEGLKKYPNYVPLKGWEDETIAESMEQAGRVSGGGLGSKGLSITGADIKRAGGRVTKASNPLGHFLADYQRTIERAQRNRVANKFFELAEKYTEGPWQVWEGGMQRADFVRKPKGSPPIAKISSIPTPPSNTISFKRFGEVKHLQIRDKALLRAMKTLDAQDSNFLFKLFAKYNRVMGALITSLNPEFMITNAIRDAQFAILRAGTDHDARIAAKTAKDYIPSIAQILKSEMGQKTSPTPETKRLERYWREFKEEGTLTGYTITDKAPDALKKMQAELETGFKGEALRAFRAGARQIETLNTAIESMGRLSYYAALRDQGISPKRAAYLAKNLTINFNRRGTAGQALNAWWLFFNAAIQGNAAFARMVKSPKGVAAIGALAAAGLLADLGNGLFGPEDEERDMAEWDKKPMQERSTNLVLMRGKDDSFDWRFPVGYGLNVPFTIGQLVGQAARRKEVSPQDAMIQTALAGINGFSPVRWTNNFVQTATPTIGRIPVDMEVNQDFAGREIARTTGPWDVRPESQKGTDRQSVFSKNLAQFMNEATGGNEWQSGKLDPHPANIDYVIRNSLGGLGSLLGATIALPQEISKNDLTAREVPFVRKVISQRSDFANQTDARNLGKAMGQIEKRAKQDTTFAKERPELVKLAEDYKDLTKQAKKAREEAKDKGAELDLKAQERFWAPFLRKARDLGVEP